MTDEPLFPQSSAPKARAKPENKTLSRIGLALASVGVAVVSFFHIAKELPGIPRDTSSEEALANASYAYGHIVGGLFFDVLVAWAILYFVFVRPSKRKVGGKYFAILAGVAVLTLVGCMVLRNSGPAARASAAAPAAAASSDADGFNQAVASELASFDARMAELGLGETLDLAQARKDVNGFRTRVARSQVLVGLHRGRTNDNIETARSNANRRAGGGPEGAAAMTAFDAAHAEAKANNARRWMLEARVAETRGLVMQSLAYDPDNAGRMGSDVGAMRMAEAELKAFKANKAAN